MIFCRLHDLTENKLEEYDILSYIVYLKKKLKSPGAVLNYLSTARTWTLAVTGSAKSFDTYRVTTLKKGLKRTMSPVLTNKPPFLIEHLKHVVDVFDSLGSAARVMKAYILIAFCSALRQSNLILHNLLDKEEHVLLARNVSVTKKGLELVIRTSKTTTCYEQKLIVIPRASNPQYCPVVAWLNFRVLKAAAHARLAFVTSNGSPLLSRPATNLIRQALTHSTYKRPMSFTLHDIRRASVQTCAKGGATLGQLKALGGWKSDAIFSYLPRELVAKGPSTLSASLG